MKRWPLLVSIMSLSIFVGFSYAADNYLLTDLGTLGYDSSKAKAINDKGVVVGTAESLVAVKWENGQGMILPRPDTDTLSYGAYSINEKNEIVGANDLYYIGYATLWSDDGRVRDIVGRAVGVDINNHSQVVGWQDVKTHIVGFLWENGHKQDMLYQGEDAGLCFPTAINDTGKAVGSFMLAPYLYASAFIWENDELHDLNMLVQHNYDGHLSQAHDINKARQIIVSLTDRQNSEDTSVLFENGNLTDLGPIKARAINDRGQIIGTKTLYEKGIVYDLNMLIESIEAFSDLDASDINNLGQIVGSATICDETHAILLEPIDLDSVRLISFDFSTVNEDFIYNDDLFHNTDNPSYASGSWSASSGFCASGGLQVSVGGVDSLNIDDGMSGGWRYPFYVNNESDTEIRLKYRLTTSKYDADECATVLIAIDGDIVMETAQLCGRNQDTGWETLSFNQFLLQGMHTLTVGVYNNKKTGQREITNAYFDDLSILIHEPDTRETHCDNGFDDDGDDLTDCDDPDCESANNCQVVREFGADFNSGDDNFQFQADVFDDTHQPLYASGDWMATGGYAGSGGLHLTLGNLDSAKILDGISGGWVGEFNLSSAMDVVVSLKYRLVMTRFDKDECAKVLVKIDNGTIEFVEQLCGRRKDTGWKTMTFPASLSAGDHSVTVGGYVNKKTGALEKADIYIDDIVVR